MKKEKYFFCNEFMNTSASLMLNIPSVWHSIGTQLSSVGETTHRIATKGEKELVNDRDKSSLLLIHIAVV
jgi:hypothetical protein